MFLMVGIAFPFQSSRARRASEIIANGRSIKHTGCPKDFDEARRQKTIRTEMSFTILQKLRIIY